MRRGHAAAFYLLSVFSFFSFGTGPGQAVDLIWEVESPFRFFKSTRSFALHERAYDAVRGDPNGALPNDIVWRTERRLNDPACRDSSTPERCAATARNGYNQARLGWAAQTLNDTCYQVDGRPRRYSAICERRYSWGAAKEDYILPPAHTVTVAISPDQLKGVTGDCVWTWTPRKAGGKAETKKQACKNKLTIARVPYSVDRASSGVAVSVKLPDGRELSDPNVVVEDLLIVALGDSFASGESNPDKPVSFSPSRQMVYDPALLRDDQMAAIEPPEKSAVAPGFGLASRDDINPKVLPRRYMEDEAAEKFYKLSSLEFEKAFDKSGAQWLSRDCHRSQYGYPFRVALQLALENRQRSVTLVSLTCSGAEVAAGLFMEMDAREGFSDPKAKKVRPQFDSLTELMCRETPSQAASYTLPVYTAGQKAIEMKRVSKSWCPPQARKRPIDLVLLSIGGNDVGFSGLVAYTMSESASDFAPIAGWIGSSIRFGPDVSRAYLGVLDERMKAVKAALSEGFGVEPTKVLQSSYEPIQYDETGALCGSQPTLGMDVHPKLSLSQKRLKEAADFLNEFLVRLGCITKHGPRCPTLATGAGTGFTLVTDHLPAFAKRGVCARDPKKVLVDGVNMQVPRRAGADEFKPYSPAYHLPYARQWRLFRTPNDAFMTANTHREGISPFDILQPAYAGLYSGAIHPTAEGHAIVADYVVKHAREKLKPRGHIEIRPTTVSTNN